MTRPSTVFLLGAAWYGLLAFLLTSALANADSVAAVASGAVLAGVFSSLAIIFLRAGISVPHWPEEIEVPDRPRHPSEPGRDDRRSRSKAA